LKFGCRPRSISVAGGESVNRCGGQQSGLNGPPVAPETPQKISQFPQKRPPPSQSLSQK